MSRKSIQKKSIENQQVKQTQHNTNFESTNPHQPTSSNTKSLKKSLISTSPILNTVQNYFAKLNSKPIFYLVWIILLFSLMSLRYTTKINAAGDDNVEYNFGLNNYKYFTSFGKDTSYKHLTALGRDYTPLLSTEQYYGAGFEMIAIYLKKIFQPKDFYLARQLMCVFIFSFIILFIGLFAAYLWGWNWGIVGMLFYVNIPEMLYLGLTSNNIKDIPFALGCLIFVYGLIKIFNEFPQLKKQNFIWLGLGFFIAMITRLGALMFLVYIPLTFFAFYFFNKKFKSEFQKNKKLVIKTLLTGCVVIFISCLLALSLSYYNFWLNPSTHVQNGLKVLADFPQKIPVLYNGETILSTELPPNYIFDVLIKSLPIYLLICFILFLTQFIFKYKKFFSNQTIYMALLLIFLFPLVYIYLTHAAVYDKWRHVSFIIFAMLILGLIALKNIKNASVNFKYVVFGIVTIFFVKTLIWNIVNYPLQTAYWNELIGGTKGAWLKHELDPQTQATRPAFEWLLTSKTFKDLVSQRDSNNPIIIATNSSGLNQDEMDLPLSLKKKIKIVETGFKGGYSSFHWDFGLFGTIFVSPQILNVAFPPAKGVMHVIQVDGVPIEVIVHRENDFDVIAMNAMNQQNLSLAAENFQKAYNYDPTNFRIWNYYAYILYQQGNISQARSLAQQYLELFPDDQLANQILGNHP